ncbi:MAG: hypothetical protein PVJ66_03650 [Gammaproteobacteria bacterium]|jgi:hypothetical protein
MIFRLLVGAGLFGMGFYLGRELGRTESIRQSLDRSGRSTRLRGKVLESTDYHIVKETRPGGQTDGQVSRDA